MFQGYNFGTMFGLGVCKYQKVENRSKFTSLTFEKIILNKNTISFVICVAEFAQLISIEVLVFRIASGNFRDDVQVSTDVETIY